MTVAVFNELDQVAAVELLMTCCASKEWAVNVAAERPFDGAALLLDVAERRWTLLPEAERLKAIEAHPPIGAPAAASDRERREQAGAAQADQATREALAALNEAYRERFGFVFLTDASGRDASDMLAELRTRIANSPEQERAKAEDQQWRIMRRRAAACDHRARALARFNSRPRHRRRGAGRRRRSQHQRVGRPAGVDDGRHPHHGRLGARRGRGGSQRRLGSPDLRHRRRVLR